MGFVAPSLPVHKASLPRKSLEKIKINLFRKLFLLQFVSCSPAQGRCALQMFPISHVLIIQPFLVPSATFEEYHWTHKVSFYNNKIWNHTQWWMGRIKLAFCCSIFILAHLYSLSCQAFSKICAMVFFHLCPTGLFFFLSFCVPIYYSIYLYSFILSLCKNLSLVSLFCSASASVLPTTEARQFPADSWYLSYGKLQQPCSHMW